MIKVDGLTKVYKNSRSKLTVAVNKVTFKCERGKIVGLLGPNGAGKTTTLRMIATILSPTSGTAIVNGYDIITHPDFVRSTIGFLTGETGLYARFTPRETLHYFGHINEMNNKDINKRIEELSDIFGMADFLGERIYNLSSGMKQKVSLSRTMIHNPPVLILDEPTIGLDIFTTKNIINFIKRSREEGKCILLSTHTLYEAETMCDDVVIINRGNIVGEGSLPCLFDTYHATNLEEVFLSLVENHDEF